MPLFRHKFRIESARLKSWDYSWPAWYYVTIVVAGRSCVFGEIQGDEVVLNPLGQATDASWQEIPKHHQDVELDGHIVMPNHIHGIVILNDTGSRTDVGRRSRDVQLNVSTKALMSPKKGSLSIVVRTFKAVTAWARRNGHRGFRWQGRFHDHIIRDENDLHRIRKYIFNNPLQWALDEENPENVQR